MLYVLYWLIFQVNCHFQVTSSLLFLWSYVYDVNLYVFTLTFLVRSQEGALGYRKVVL